jgi:hypothetical protein
VKYWNKELWKLICKKKTFNAEKEDLREKEEISSKIENTFKHLAGLNQLLHFLAIIVLKHSLKFDISLKLDCSLT